MTYEEAIETLRHCHSNESCEGCKLYVGENLCSDFDNTLTYGAIFEHHDKYAWHDLRKDETDLPDSEREVIIVYGYAQVPCMAFYEDGKTHADNSEWWFGKYHELMEYCEETDDYIIPKGWYTNNPFIEGFGEVQQPVIAWREIEPFKSEVEE